MSNAATNNPAPEHSEGLSREKIQQIIATVGSQKTDNPPQADQIEAAEYNWHQPHYFSSEQLSRLDDFTKKTAEAVAGKLAALCHSDFNVTVASTTQHFADEFLSEDTDNQNYCLTFGTDQSQPFGLISIPAQTAIVWTTQLLGDTESEENSDRDLSQLEESLLLDIASALVEALSNSCDDYNLQPVGTIIKKQLPLELQGTEELCKITFNVSKADSEDGSEAYFLIPCGKLETVTGNNSQADNKFSAEDASKAMLEHIQQIPIPVTVQLASAELTFEEIASLQTDDILLLDKKISEPVELIVEGKIAFRGKPAKSDGRYAVVIT